MAKQGGKGDCSPPKFCFGLLVVTFVAMSVYDYLCLDDVIMKSLAVTQLSVFNGSEVVGLYIVCI